MRSDNTPPAELYVLARALNADYRTKIEIPEWGLARHSRDWRRFVAPPIQQVWSRMSEEARLAVYVNAEQTRLALAKKDRR